MFATQNIGSPDAIKGMNSSQKQWQSNIKKQFNIETKFDLQSNSSLIGKFQKVQENEKDLFSNYNSIQLPPATPGRQMDLIRK